MEKDNNISDIIANLIIVYAIITPFIVITYTIYCLFKYSDLNIISVIGYSFKRLWFIVVPHIILIIASILYTIFNKEEADEDSD